MNRAPHPPTLSRRRAETRLRGRRLKILMLGHWLPSVLWEADVRRTVCFARLLAGHHRVTLAFVTDDPGPFGALTALRAEFEDIEFAVVSRSWKRFAGMIRLAMGQSATITHCSSRALRTRLRDRTRADAHDGVLVSSSGMTPYLADLDPSTPVLVDFGEMDSDRWARRARARGWPWAALYRAEADRLREVEIGGARRAARCLVASPEAAAVVGSVAPWASATVIRNGVDVDEFASPPRESPAPIILFAGWADPEIAVDLGAFCHTTLRAVRARVPEARLVLVSRRTTTALRRLARLPGVELAAPAMDIRASLHRAAVAVAPIRGGRAMQDSVLEAMAAGVPVVATARGHGGLAARPGQEIFVEEDPGAFAHRVIQLLESHALRADTGARARAFVAKHHSWDAAGQALLPILDDVAGRARQVGPSRFVSLKRLSRPD